MKASAARVFAVTTLLLVVPAVTTVESSQAQGNCGAGWGDQETTAVTKSRSSSQGARGAAVSFDGKVLVCKQFPNRYGRRILIGVPTPLTVRATYTGTDLTESCLVTEVQVLAKGVKRKADVAVSVQGKALKGTVTTSVNPTTGQFTWRNTRCVKPGVATITDSMAGLRLTSDLQFTSVSIHVTASLKYRSGTITGGWSVLATKSVTVNNPSDAELVVVHPG